jgi:hypothetical protein
MRLVLQPFPAYNYFFGREGGVYFSVPTYQGNLQLEYPSPQCGETFAVAVRLGTRSVNCGDAR